MYQNHRYANYAFCCFGMAPTCAHTAWLAVHVKGTTLTCSACWSTIQYSGAGMCMGVTTQSAGIHCVCCWWLSTHHVCCWWVLPFYVPDPKVVFIVQVMRMPEEPGCTQQVWCSCSHTVTIKSTEFISSNIALDAWRVHPVLHHPWHSGLWPSSLIKVALS